MRLFLVVALGLELVLAVTVASGTCFMRRDMVHAFQDARKNPSERTLNELKRQERISLATQIGFGAFIFVALALPTLTWSLRHFSAREEPRPSQKR